MDDEKMLRKFERAGVPKRFQGKVLDDYNIAKGDKAVAEAVWSYIEVLDAHMPPKGDGVGMTLSGPPGRAKSMLGAIIVQEAIRNGFKARFLTLAGYVHLLQRRFDLRNALPQSLEDFMGATDLIDRLFSVPLLVLDDVGKEHFTGTRFAQTEFDYLFRRRFDKGLPTIPTTNWGPADWSEHYGEAMASFIHEAAPILPVLAEKDYRRRKHESPR